CFLFCQPPASSQLVRDSLTQWATRLGYHGVEVFPKQTKLAAGGVDTGNWLNMPYQKGSKSTRYAFKDGKALTPEQFLDYADLPAVTPEALKAIELPGTSTISPTIDQYFHESPPCLQTLAEQRFPDYRNNAMFSIGVYMKKRFPKDWPERLNAVNQKFFD